MKILKFKDMSLKTKVKITSTMAFPDTMYRYENWTVKKANWGK